MTSFEKSFNNIRLYNLVKLSEKMLFDIPLVLKLVANNRHSQNRTRVIEWMKKVTFFLQHTLFGVWKNYFSIFLFDLQTFGVHFRDERDASIQIFDKVLLLTFAEDERKINDVNFLFHLAAASIIIACKLSDGNSHVSEVGIYNQHCRLLPLLIVSMITSISQAYFSGQLNVQVLRNFEREILATSRCSISTQCTPINFARCLMKINPVGENVDQVMDTVDTLLSEFWEGHTLSLFLSYIH